MCVNIRMVLDYLVHYGYCNTAQVFANATGQQVEEEVASIRNRQSKVMLLLIACLNNTILMDYIMLACNALLGYHGAYRMQKIILPYKCS